jgi:hypothetical protein
MTTIGEKQMKATALMHHISLGFKEIPENQTIQVVEKSMFNNELYLALAVPLLQAESSNMRLWWCLTSGNEHYCIVVQSRAFDQDQPTTALMVLRVLDQNNLSSISEEEFQRVSHDCSLAVASQPRATELTARPALGEFPETDI